MELQHPGKIAAYGLKKGETSESTPLRQTSLDDVWYGTPLETELSGGMMLEWIAAMTIVAAAYDILFVKQFVKILKAEAEKGGQDGFII